MLGIGVSAGDVAIQACKAVNQAVLDQKIESTIHSSRRRSLSLLGEPVDDFIGADGGMAFGDDLQNPSPLWGQPHLPVSAQALGVAKDGFAAVMMIVACAWESGNGLHDVILGFQTLTV